MFETEAVSEDGIVASAPRRWTKRCGRFGRKSIRLLHDDNRQDLGGEVAKLVAASVAVADVKTPTSDHE